MKVYGGKNCTCTEHEGQCAYCARKEDAELVAAESAERELFEAVRYGEVLDRNDD